ncbi:hypothetical protein, partial [Microbacterium sp. ZXX196]|uniref:hypothetical protein n=1 Tax=Microbacterium sp. ZXX196 TaxID=2609291 RepID=UPI001326E537
MVRLNLKAVEERVKPLGGRDAYDREFIFDLLLAYGKPRSNVTRLRNGSRNCPASSSWQDFFSFKGGDGGVGQAQV